jgi:hypothetical protein
MEIKKIIAIGNSGNANQVVELWAKTISVKFNEPAINITGIKIKLIETS